MSLKPIKLFGSSGGPNPWKVQLILEELDIPYECEYPEMKDLHTPVFEKYNPNGRLPAIIDPNNGGFTIWESGAILEYLVDKYDTSNKLHAPSGHNDHYLEQQYLHFQMSGQGPYFGQAYWFEHYHPEKIQSAIERYNNEAKRVIAVLDTCLQGKEYLAGDKLSYADLAFVPWFWAVENPPLPTSISGAFAEGVKGKDSFNAWLERLNSRPLVKKLRKERAEMTEKAMAARKAANGQ